MCQRGGLSLFGYVVANIEQLDEAQRARYQQVYCGLCRALGERHGARCRLTLTYDMTFLILLLSALQAEDDMRVEPFRCPMHPVKKRESAMNAWTDYAADVNVVLAYYQKMDDWTDDRSTWALAQAKAIGSQVEAVCKRLPRQCEAIAKGLEALSSLEKSGEPNPDLPAAAFGSILGAVFTPEGAEPSQDLYAFGDKLGRFVYLMDAVVDLKKDIRHEQYNPMVFVDSSRHESILQVLMADCVEPFSRLNLYRDRDLMENILYSGVWARYLAARKGDRKP
ncbi:MAG: DUF5685 family protein [Eubacteriales bacterium]|nr:DUF5685 family protein [Eubacteriales bacterium]